MTKKIFNDPVYGFLSVPYGIIFDLVEHPYFQRLRHIKQLGLTHYVYPGALHTRFNHALGAFHLMCQAIDVLRSKGIEITDEEAEGVCIAILLHDIGHGPFSHTLEHSIIDVHHEALSILFMEQLNEEFGGKLSLAIKIFKNEYSKPFLHQLVSSQLDMDRMDYLNRDSFFTGVYEGVIGYDRIIQMLYVENGKLVVEEKGIYSVEKFLMARRLMYWQVYLHKTVLAAEQMLVRTFQRAKFLALQDVKLNVSEHLAFFLYYDVRNATFAEDKRNLLRHFALLDDIDIVSALKSFMSHPDFLLSFLSTSLVQRKLFKIELSNSPFERDYVQDIRQKIIKKEKIDSSEVDQLVFEGIETNSAYSTTDEEILIRFKNGKILPISDYSEAGIQTRLITKYYLCYPKEIYFQK